MTTVDNPSQTIDMDDLPAVIERGAFTEFSYLKAVSFLRDERFWKQWAIRALMALAIGHILSGIIFFFAFNWNAFSGMMKFSVVGGGIAACLFAWILSKLDSPEGQAFGIGATVLVGVMFAVLGQVYQTPAMLHTPFVFWALLTLPFALASRNLAHWTVWLVILTVAVSSYANFGLRLAGDDIAANLLNLAVAGGIIGGLILLDQLIAPRLAWARAEWFRVCLVLGAVGFSFIGFVESFWSHGRLIWTIPLLLLWGLAAYLYIFKPTLAALSLASFGFFTLIAQFGFKFFEDDSSSVEIYFLLFIWLIALTIGLVAIFRHFVSRFKTGPDRLSPMAVPSEANGVSVTDFSNHLNLDEADVRDVLIGNADQKHPWYLSVFLGIAGVLTAIIGCAFFGSLLSLILGFENEVLYGVLGVVIFAAAILIRLKLNSPYVQNMVNTLIIVGGIMTTIGFGIEVNHFETTLVIIFLLAVIILVAVKDPILEFLAASAIIAVIGAELYKLELPLAESILLVIATGLGVIFLSQPIWNRLYKSAGTAFLMAPALLGISLVHTYRWDGVIDASRLSDDWVARILSFVVLLVAILYLNRGKAIGDIKPPLLVLLALVIGTALVPLGGASALLFILTGYILGSRSLAIIGALLQIYFLTIFYYDLSLDLLTKSIILFVSGIVFMCVWYFIQKRTEAVA